MRVLVALLVLVLAACSSGPVASGPADTATAPTGTPPGATAPPIATEEPGSSVTGPVLPTTAPVGPDWTPRPVASILLNAAVSVLVDRLNVREMPAVKAKSLGIVEAGDFLVIDGYGPFANDGYSWYHAIFVGKAGSPPAVGVDLIHSDGMRGWIAVAKGSAPYVKQLQPRCPATIDLASVQYMLGAEALACFGSHTIELSGTFGCGGCGGAMVGSFEPAWLAYPLDSNPITVYPVGDNLGPFGIRFAPDGPAAPPAGSVVRVRGHFDDDAADTCVTRVVDPLRPDGEHLVPVPSAAAQLVCAQQFVVESIEVLGTDPGFVLG